MSLKPSAHDRTTLPPLHTTSLLSPNMASKRAQGWHVGSQHHGGDGTGEGWHGKTLAGSSQHGGHADADHTMARRSSVQFVEPSEQDSTPNRSETRRASLLASSPRHAHFGPTTTFTEDTPRLAGSPTAAAALHDTRAFRQSMADFLNVMYGTTATTPTKAGNGGGVTTNATITGGTGTTASSHTRPGDTNTTHTSGVDVVGSDKEPASMVTPPVVGAPHPIHKWKTTMHLSDTATATRSQSHEPPTSGGAGDTVATALAGASSRRGWPTTRTAPSPHAQPHEDNIDTLVDHFVRALSRQTTMGATAKDASLPQRSKNNADGGSTMTHNEGNGEGALDEGMPPLYPNTGRTTMSSRALSHRHNTRGAGAGSKPQQEVSMFVSQAMDSFFGAGQLHLNRATAASTKSVLSTVWHDPNFARLLSFNTRSNLGPTALDGAGDEDAAATTVLQPMYIGTQAVFQPIEARSQVSFSHRSEMMFGRIPPSSIVDAGGRGENESKDELDQAFVLPSAKDESDDACGTDPHAMPGTQLRDVGQTLHATGSPRGRGRAHATGDATESPTSPRKGNCGRLEAQFASLNSNLFQKSSADAAEDSWAEVDAQMRVPAAPEAKAKRDHRPNPRSTRSESASPGDSPRRTSSREAPTSTLPAVTSLRTPAIPQTASRQAAHVTLGEALYRKLAEEEALSRSVMVAVERQLRAYINAIAAEGADDRPAGRPLHVVDKPAKS